MHFNEEKWSKTINSFQLPLWSKSPHNSTIFPSVAVHGRGKILRNLSVIPKSYLWDNQWKNQIEINFGLCPDLNLSFSSKLNISVMTKLLHYFFNLTYTLRVEILISLKKNSQPATWLTENISIKLKDSSFG